MFNVIAIEVKNFKDIKGLKETLNDDKALKLMEAFRIEKSKKRILIKGFKGLSLKYLHKYVEGARVLNNYGQ